MLRYGSAAYNLIIGNFFESTTLATSRSKRWNGNFDSLPVPYLKAVAEKMADYGDRVQFSLVSGGAEPSYKVMNEDGKAMAFDRNHHLLHPQGEEFVGVNASSLYTLEQVNAAISGSGIRTGTTTRARVARATGGGTRTTAAKLEEQFATQRYEYYRNNRSMLPSAISQHSNEIVELMRAGKPVEQAFDEVVKKHF